MAFLIENDGVAINNGGFAIKNEGFCWKNDGLSLQWLKIVHLDSIRYT